MLLFVLLIWRLYFAADTSILSPHNSTTVGCRSDESDSSLSEVHRYSLFLLSVFLPSLTEVISVLRKFHFAFHFDA